MDIKITGGRILTAEKTLKAEIAVRNGTIAAIAPSIDAVAGRTIDATGMIVMPGVIDAHVHFQMPSAVTVTADDFEGGTKAAACGGVTTVIDFAIQRKGRTLREAVELRRAEADGKVVIDYSLHAVPTDWNSQTRKEIEKTVISGITTFKAYMAYEREGLMLDDNSLLELMQAVGRCGAMVTVHAESAPILNVGRRRYHNVESMRLFGAFCHALSRPKIAENEATQRAAIYSGIAECPIYIVHMSSGAGAGILNNARSQDFAVYGETCPHYLILDNSVFLDRNGHLYATCPPLREHKDSERLWQGITDGDIQVVATDSCTFTKKQKARWKGDFSRIPCGMPGVETLLPLMYTYGVGKKKITENQLVRVLCENPARLMGFFPKKGSISVGADADLVIFDPGKRITISHKNLRMNCDWSPYEGFKVKGYPHLTISRGEVVAEDGKFVGKAGHGRFVKRGMPSPV